MATTSGTTAPVDIASTVSKPAPNPDEEPGVELGFVAEFTNSRLLHSAFFPSKVGGRPAWLHLSSLPSTESLRCRRCSKPSVFLMQIYAPIEGQWWSFHRTLFVFVCRDPACSSPNTADNFLVFRSQLPRKNPFYSFVPPDYDADSGTSQLRCAADFASLCVVCGCVGTKSCGGCKSRTFCSKEHQKVDWTLGGHKASCGKDPHPSSAGNDAFLFPEHQVETEAEDYDEELNEEEEEEDEEGREKGEEEWKTGGDQELSERDLESMASRQTQSQKAFAFFKKRMSQAPDQILRYCRGGSPLWISDSPIPDVPPCPDCGAKRNFEFQIMPQLLTHLNVDDVGKSIDWGVLAIFTCSRSCDVSPPDVDDAANKNDAASSASDDAPSPTFNSAYKLECLVKQDFTQ